MARELEERGVRDHAYALKLLRRRFPPPPSKLQWSEGKPAPLAEAIEAVTPGDERNIGNVRRLMRELLRSPVVVRGAIMPDACPAGNEPGAIPVGGVIAARNAIVPSAHGMDICCSMFATFYRSDLPVAEQLDHLMNSTRFGPGGRAPEDNVPHPVLDEDVWDNPFLRGLERQAAMHMADQGDGNHFASIGKITFTREALDRLAAAGHVEHAEALGGAAAGPRLEYHVLVTHHGSRGLGAHVYKRGRKAAEEYTKQIAEGVPAAASWLDADSEEGRAYWEALRYVGRWTRANHESIHARFLERAGARAVTAFGNEHNFVWKRGDLFLHGKGATPAWRDEAGRPLLGLIPMNMASPILLALGGDNEGFLSFAPHGAGRNVSRTALVKPWRLKDGTLDEKAIRRVIEEQTEGLDIRWYHGKPDLAESPIAYKPPAQVREQIERFKLAEIVGEIQPLGCIMAGYAGPRPWERLKEELTPKQKRQIEHRAERRAVRQLLHSRRGFDDEDDE